MALVRSRSATRRSSFAFASVVSIRSWRTRFAVRLRNIARLLLLPALDHLGPVVDLHPQGQPHVREDLLDLLQALPAEVLRLQHVLLRALHELTDEGDVRVLEAVRRADRELQLVDR